MSEKLTRSHNVIGEDPYDERTVGAGCYRTLKDTTKPWYGMVWYTRVLRPTQHSIGHFGDGHKTLRWFCGVLWSLTGTGHWPAGSNYRVVLGR